jgi:hypothetical protein
VGVEPQHAHVRRQRRQRAERERAVGRQGHRHDRAGHARAGGGEQVTRRGEVILPRRARERAIAAGQHGALAAQRRAQRPHPAQVARRLLRDPGLHRGERRHRASPYPQGVGLQFVRYGIPALLVLAGFVVLFVADDSARWDGFAGLVGAGLAVLLLNWLFRLGAEGDKERRQEEEARDFYSQHGHWPDEPPPPGR